ncbi:hypothetical protein QTI17_28630 [Variovorax sp. J31P179]|uniref:hypothetical protein n=1 Tax=Variovorax sp. J31P179 TaxID=3053508 RepID=UPI00257557EF|nr:hypothetical protein [Variovorax sp. J31P179]MDM0084574.1 hypothetical protein [Variovorax sp. J31P179]
MNELESGRIANWLVFEVDFDAFRLSLNAAQGVVTLTVHGHNIVSVRSSPSLDG